jgi:hypothetical protein
LDEPEVCKVGNVELLSTIPHPDDDYHDTLTRDVIDLFEVVDLVKVETKEKIEQLILPPSSLLVRGLVEEPIMLTSPEGFVIIDMPVPDYYSLPFYADEFYEVEFEVPRVEDAYREVLASRATGGKSLMNSTPVMIALFILLHLLIFLSLDFG